MTRKDTEKSTVSDEEWARAMSEEPEDIAEAENSNDMGKTPLSSAANAVPRRKKTKAKTKGQTPGNNDGGYANPPKKYQWPKGQSGNPKGKKTGTRDFATDLKETLNAPVKLTDEGKPHTVSTQKAALLRLREKALKGDARALDRLLGLAETHNKEDLSKAVDDTLTPSDQAILDNYLARHTDEPDDRDKTAQRKNEDGTSGDDSGGGDAQSDKNEDGDQDNE